MAMEAAVDIDSAGDFSVHSSHSGLGSRSRSSAYSSAGHTGVDVESGEAAHISGSKGHRSTYAKLAEEALLGAAGPPIDPEIRIALTTQPVDLGVSDFQDANGGAWRMGSAGAFWRLDAASSESPRAGLRSSSGRDAKIASKPRRCKTICWAPIAAGIIAVIVAAFFWNLQSRIARVVSPQAGAQHRASLSRSSSGDPQASAGDPACCTMATAECFACFAGQSLKEFCETSSLADSIAGCKASGCCHDSTANCLSCKSSQTAEEYCAVPTHHNVTGCGGSHCSLLEEDIVYPGGDLYSVGGVPSAPACCDICREESKCTSWSWGGDSPGSVFRNRCFLKRQVELKTKSSPGYVSGLPGRDEGDFQVKNRHGLCLDFSDDHVRLEACAAQDVLGQRLTYQRQKRRISTKFHLCLEAAGAIGQSHHVGARLCKTSKAMQQWSYHSHSGQLRTPDDLCLHAVDRATKGSKVEAQPCEEKSEAQQWSFWSVELLHLRSTMEAIKVEALEPTTTTATTTSTVSSTTTTSKTTTEVPDPTLYCYSVMVSWNYEPTLVAMQILHKRSIFSCEASDVYSDKVMKIGDRVTTKVKGTDLKCEKGGPFNTLLNTPMFIKVWEQVLRDGNFRKHEWIVKVDCDAVFLPNRLLRLVQGPALEGAQEGRGVFINNCGFGLHGPLEVVSRKALETYGEGYKDCPTPPQEDVYLQACMNHLGVKQVNQFNLLSEDHCRTPNWQDCQSEHVSFHPFKDVEAYEACESRAKEASMLVKKK